MKLKNKVAVVTGASKGIGKAVALAFAREGASVVPASRTPAALEDVVREIRAAGGEASAVSVDVRSVDSINALVKKAVDRYGRLDLLVNNAGITMGGPSEDLAPEDWRAALETDLFGVFYACQAAARVMIPQGGGNIINISSVNGILAAPRRAAYCASKAAVNELTKVLAIEWADRKIRVNAIAPGYVRTELVEDVIHKGAISLEAILKRTPQGRIGEVGDIASLAVYMAGDESSYMTGSIVNIDGGWLAYGYL
ncbi:MAG: 3-oxoacyl-ACP reductase FabG [Smithella sp.]|jgi:3-oxoacyl-[acyl-carrier protein] reductase|nr:3-oxoacyl-ACP reductase FabG [Smithella sp.]HNY73514.1 3-oxoacyl-ACP reductase family protein [Syntrophales bacterium]HPL10384.1 3-oxoacyl-ACP reductase family protein [Smithellaceae bacterium]